MFRIFQTKAKVKIREWFRLYWTCEQAWYVMRCAIWYRLYNLKNVKNTHGRALLLVKLQAKSNIPPWVFFMFFKLYKWYPITQNITYIWLFKNQYPGRSFRQNHLQCLWILKLQENKKTGILFVGTTLIIKRVFFLIFWHIFTGFTCSRIYLFKVKKENTKTMCKICSKLPIKTPATLHWLRSRVFIVNFEQISNIVFVFQLLTLSKRRPTRHYFSLQISIGLIVVHIAWKMSNLSKMRFFIYIICSTQTALRYIKLQSENSISD